MILVGLTGNYGMGKSAALEIFASLGARVINSDEIVAKLLESAAVLEKIRALLGGEVFDEQGKLIKGKVSDIIFSDSRMRRGIEDILHPLVLKEIERLSKGMTGVVVVEVPLLFEGGHEGRFQKTITVYADEETGIKRLVASGVRREDAIRRLDCQMPIAEKIRRADYSIDNSGGIEETRAQIKAIYEELLKA